MPLKFELVPEPWPNFTENQVAFLEKMFPARCITRSEALEDHLWYAGKQELVAQLREHVIGSPVALQLTEEEEDALDDMAVQIAHHGQEQGEQ